MNMLQLEKHLFEIAETIPHKYIAEQFEPIIYAIVRFYAVTEGYYPEDDLYRIFRILVSVWILNRRTTLMITRKEAKEILILSKRGESIKSSDGEREVIHYSDGFHCISWNDFDPEYITKDIDNAIDYILPY